MQIRHPFTLATRAVPRLAVRPENTLLLVQDFQQYFVNPECGFGGIAQKRGVEDEFTSYYDQINIASSRIKELYERARSLMMPTAFSSWAYENEREISLIQRAIGVMIPAKDSLAEIKLPLDFSPEDFIFNKQGLGCFSSQSFVLELERRRIENLLLTGVVTEFGIRSTALAAIDYGYRVIIVKDACAGITATSHQIATDEIIFGNIKVRRTREVLLALDVLENEDVVLI